MNLAIKKLYCRHSYLLPRVRVNYPFPAVGYQEFVVLTRSMAEVDWEKVRSGELSSISFIIQYMLVVGLCGCLQFFRGNEGAPMLLWADPVAEYGVLSR